MIVARREPSPSLAAEAQKRVPGENPYYCWYSAMAVTAGVKPSVYIAADGTELTTTLVSRTPDHGCKWPDLKFVGRAQRWYVSPDLARSLRFQKTILEEIADK